MAETNERRGMGWLPDYPSFRDHTVDLDELPQRLKDVGQRESVKAMLKKVGVAAPLKAPPASVDLRAWCSAIEDQGALGSCTANAGVGIVEYFEYRAFGRHLDASRLFLYKATRNLMHLTGDTGAFLRTTMGALVLFGVPPEEYWLYTVADFDKEPTAFCYAFAQNYQAIQYYRLDPPGTSKPTLLTRIKTNLAGGLPSMFGFTVYTSISQAAGNGKIPFPTAGEKVAGGHAIVAVGYDDALKIKNTNPGGAATTGALLIRNSWGTGWGDQGYGWLPYDYVLKGLAVDWWSLLKNEWIDTGAFKV
ncbi:MAG: cysteine protease [Candidatus Methylomirabilis oxygeniifera]|uniref:Peptidase C1A, papain n=1 Tax=Methylomirabilis oxygeniifera TaxID=671143 RepID=D5MM67_METO1|nr:MAG: cysteine protease [Candidatus Methylomirabilis oxyfera]CBE67953.1 Peptidase C1A, papain [Candidatus Methylomirabilis oxyfera]